MGFLPPGTGLESRLRACPAAGNRIGRLLRVEVRWEERAAVRLLELRVELRAPAPAPGTKGARVPPGAGRRPQPLTDRSALVCLFSCRQPRGDSQNEAGEYALALEAAAAGPSSGLGLLQLTAPGSKRRVYRSSPPPPTQSRFF